MADRRNISLVTFIICCACATLGLMLSVSFTIFHIYHRNNRTVKMSSPRLNVLISFGGMMFSAVCFLYGMDFIVSDSTDQLSALCQARAWLVVMAFSLVHAPIAVKTWRVYQIFRMAEIKTVIRDGKLFLMTAVVLVVDVLFLSLWQVIDPLEAQLTQLSTQTLYGDSRTFFRNETIILQECICSKVEMWVAMALLWKLVLLVYGLHLAWKVKDVTVPALNDSAHIIVGIFGTFIFGCVGAMVTCLLQRFPDAVYILTTGCISMCTIFVQLTIFVPKICYWWRNSENPTRMSMTSIKPDISSHADDVFEADENGNSYHHDDAIMEIVQENKFLKESLIKKEALVQQLQVHVSSATEKLNAIPVEAEVKQDSGLDIDLSSASTGEDNHDDAVNQSPRRTHMGVLDLHSRMALYQVDASPRENDDVTAGNGDTETFSQMLGGEDRSSELPTDSLGVTTRYRGKGLDYSASIHSVNSRQSFNEFSEIRESIAADLSNAAVVSSDLRRSVAESRSDTEWLYQSSDSKDLADSIAQSYDLALGPETFTYLNSYMPRGNSLYQIRRNRKRSEVSMVSVQSSDNASHGSIEIETDHVTYDVIPSTRDSSTPDSQHHAAILRHYAYKHMNRNRVPRPSLLLRKPRKVPLHLDTSRSDSTCPAKLEAEEINNMSASETDIPTVFTLDNHVSMATQEPTTLTTDWNMPIDPYDSFV